MKNHVKHLLIALALCSTLNFQLSNAHAQGTACTYQGQLVSSGAPASGTYNLTFSLFNDTNSFVSPVAGPVTNNGVLVVNGLFTVTIDFGSSVWNGQTNWLEIGVETNGANSFTTLTPAQQLTPVPYAIFAESSSNLLGALPASQLTTVSDGFGNFFVGLSGNSTTTGPFNTANGDGALIANTSGSYNTAYGALTLQNNATGSYNTANGAYALLANQTGSYNTADGLEALYNNGSGNNNTAVGVSALQNLGEFAPGGTNNIALGYQAGYNYTRNESSNIDIGNLGVAGEANTIRIGSGQSQTFIAGVINGNGGGLTNLNINAAQFSGTVSNAVTFSNANNSFSGSFTGNGVGLTNLNVSASQLTSIGNANSLQGGNFFVGPSGNSRMSGSANTADGVLALLENTTGSYNTADGAQALYLNTSGSRNTAIGIDALFNNFSGSDNTAVGFNALFQLGDNGAGGSNNIALGSGAGANFQYNESGNIDIGNPGMAGENNIIRIGSGQTQTFIAGNVGLGGVTTPQQILSLDGGLNIDQTDQNGGAFNLPEGSASSACLSFGNHSGEGIASQRTSGANQYDLLFCTEFTPRMTILSTGNVGIGKTNPATLLDVNGTVTCVSLNQTSDRNAKENFAAVSPRDVLAKVAALPITEWKYKVEADGTEHLGPMAQDFHAAFGLNGPDDKHIATVDEGGVALAAIQGLNEKVESGKQKAETQIQELKAENAKLQAKVSDLQSQLDGLQKAVARLTGQSASPLALNTQLQEAQ